MQQSKEIPVKCDVSSFARGLKICWVAEIKPSLRVSAEVAAVLSVFSIALAMIVQLFFLLGVFFLRLFSYDGAEQMSLLAFKGDPDLILLATFTSLGPFLIVVFLACCVRYMCSLGTEA